MKPLRANGPDTQADIAAACAWRVHVVAECRNLERDTCYDNATHAPPSTFKDTRSQLRFILIGFVPASHTPAGCGAEVPDVCDYERKA